MGTLAPGRSPSSNDSLFVLGPVTFVLPRLLQLTLKERREGFTPRILLERVVGWIVDVLLSQDSEEPSHYNDSCTAEALRAYCHKIAISLDENALGNGLIKHYHYHDHHNDNDHHHTTNGESPSSPQEPMKKRPPPQTRRAPPRKEEDGENEEDEDEDEDEDDDDIVSFGALSAQANAEA
ncbi:hypothetical protein LTR10_016229 [Elasticomyces elasticus]|uniref:Uncharacterized protein n=1 Tax=Exophiala sideris TaxID=1016849 RepID=A0ABR0JN72_9EURO|nr:hypothetical protein LTR10_016229 [Elasticomyces elasticus]KAK5037939.1 hypothetical protein LTS07_001406 [Exophiala sideris]KAK5043922.1 hypothetical protein LTR13_000276 [Exophiala sideris]KAK5067421.1 hypothetical protein LTR69_001408 [Exophiala sideris]KAK5182754.1 hypothetical protein LTR44_005145 [Eurotiomycetes sp. CCFEE 6388]